ncbi:MAG: CDP-diacylglycerol--glycerol-3-phosphate 3-phosphatidyltransferase [Candidatus Jettenia sp.]|uniref:CDP-diacylglycerol--glycerol-3-phosphate 3-phosphatidyltransferase n=1 Tax=Candidatus Jettenia caeni TaxID=247490 RepID=I3IN66_9BACT|nr:CDP-diacylglycerol--glycerol-3-phosphate 3-phosphatidyltransferase [Candidatus Jettenia sp. AMX1]MBC6928045.1 CDP-diacylglycerol--glycerol-3-phosphate 3-phosphatidyltransferase [Candidatus Jettenia sp.]WKZ14843.1 MAG: CDP-diacylglycerol--glycerol-3-phosphate 3-phosphatidyltransferase [Candidatus Jettenia caeni]KAA0251145.1 MAG: CDP-diacylglycerol--glycerol-3-phosphate 3-phosphatidyltransferase [Candidatus Jettenia sp. AMX1]MCE7879316.1 CDP-diacylglycerol--glycerol-3-phosphate 3-phosphatidylt
MNSFDFSRCAAFNLPNRLTLMRLLLAIVFFIFLSYRYYNIALVSYLFAWLTDWLDGYLARKKGLLTDFGRIADPFVDKIIVCGGFILLIQHAHDIIPPWMVVVIVAREFLVNSLRSYSESKGIEFGATIWGKAKMFTQSFTISLILLFFAYFEHFMAVKQGIIVMLWLTVIITLVSGIKYMVKAGPAILMK